jgi:hypothetical protein
VVHRSKNKVEKQLAEAGQRYKQVCTYMVLACLQICRKKQCMN